MTDCKYTNTELNELVAEHVMGYTNTGMHFYRSNSGDIYSTFDKDKWKGNFFLPAAYMDDAMRVVQRLGVLKYSFGLRQKVEQYGNWLAIFEKDGAKYFSSSVISPNRAIIQAAMKAMGVAHRLGIK